MSDNYESPVLWAANYVERIVRREERFGGARPYTIELVERFEEEIRPLMREVDALGGEDRDNSRLRRIIELRRQMMATHHVHPHPELQSALDEITAWMVV